MPQPGNPRRRADGRHQPHFETRAIASRPLLPPPQRSARTRRRVDPQLPRKRLPIGSAPGLPPRPPRKPRGHRCRTHLEAPHATTHRARDRLPRCPVGLMYRRRPSPGRSLPRPLPPSPGSWTPHRVQEFVHRFPQLQTPENLVHGVVRTTPFLEKNGSAAKLESHDRACGKSELFAQLHRDGDLTFGGDRALHHR